LTEYLVCVLFIWLICKCIYFTLTDYEDGTTATTTTDNLYGDGRKCHISYDTHQTDQRSPGTTGCDTCVCLHICQSPCTFPCQQVCIIGYFVDL
jgi:hypothetical protein